MERTLKAAAENTITKNSLRVLLTIQHPCTLHLGLRLTPPIIGFGSSAEFR